MFLNIQPIIVPFLSAYDIFQYAESLGLNLSTTGSYYILLAARDNYNFYPSGFANNVSGSGNWGPGSGFTSIPLNYFYDNFASYTTGFNTGFLTGANQLSGYKFFAPVLYSGSMTSNVDYMYDNFASYPTGLFIQQNLFSGNQSSGYFVTFPNFYSGAFNFASTIKTGGSGGAGGSPIPFWTVTDTANPNYLWSGQGIDVNPGGFYLFPYLQYRSPNIVVQFYNGPFYGGVQPVQIFPWTGGGPVLVGNTVINEKFGGNVSFCGYDDGFSFPSSGFVELSGFGTGVITGDFTLNIIWNWRQNATPNSYNSWEYTRQDGNAGMPVQFFMYTGHNIGLGFAHDNTGGAPTSGDVNIVVTNGGPPPNSVNFGPNYFTTGFNYGPCGDYSFRNPLNQDTPLIDFDMLSGFAIYLYTSMWSGNTWLNSPNFQISNPNSQFVGGAPGHVTYTGMNSGLVTNPYVYFLGNKISGNLVGPNLPLNNLTATGALAITGGLLGFYDVVQHTGASTGCYGITPGNIVNGPMPQFTGFGFGMAQYLTLTRTGSFVSLYQSGILFATGLASGAINTTLPLLIGKFNRPTGAFIYSNTGLGLFHFDIWNFCQSQQTIASNILTYRAPPQPGLIASTNFVLK